MEWHAYILECADGTLYIGSTNDLSRRIEEHNRSAKGAKYTRARRPVILKYSISCVDRSEAGKKEAFLKSHTRAEKLALISGDVLTK